MSGRIFYFTIGKGRDINTRLIFLISCLAITLSGYAMQPVVILMGGAVTPLGQQSQTLYYANTVFKYQPHDSSALKPLVGGFIGAEYPFNEMWAWQSGLAFYQAASSSIDGEEAQAPILNLDAVNIWNYQYKISSRQLLFENKLLLALHEYYHPYVLIGLGAGFNHAYEFQVTPQNSGEVATAIFGGHTNTTFIYMAGLGLDIDVSENMRIGAGYRFVYLGKYDLGNGMLDTGAGGSVFSLPALKSAHSYNHEVLIQLTYLI